jgi:NAD(P)-dependent dehydrogenase (short-subunit alcohol dehydrogenase family)
MTESHHVVVITGATAGIGRATAQAFARRGWRVAILAREPQALADTQRELEALGAAVLGEAVDVADAGAVFAAAQRIEAAWGRIDAWINNAMATVFAPITTITPEEYARVTGVTYLGAVHGTLAALRAMQPRDAGTIVQVGSALSYRAIPLQAPYCAAKFALRGFTDALRSELHHAGSRIRLVMVQLPAVNTPQFDWARSRMPRRAQPVPPIHRPEDIAEAIIEATLRAPREQWVGTPTIKAILGQMFIPAALDRLLSRRAWDGQMTGAPEPGHPDNLFAPVVGAHRMEGRFGDRTVPAPVSVDAGRLRAGLALGAVAVVAVAVLVAALWR